MKKHDKYWRTFSQIKELIWRRIEGQEGRVWYVPLTPNAGDLVHCDDPDKSGYNGSRVEFELVSGRIESIRGPWHHDSQKFIDDTGLDISNLHLTAITVRGPKDEVIYHEPGRTLGSAKRGMEVAQEIANLYGKSMTVEIRTGLGRDWRYVEPEMERGA